jgi:hypothetical protein
MMTQTSCVWWLNISPLKILYFLDLDISMEACAVMLMVQSSLDRGEIASNGYPTPANQTN